MMKAGLMTPDGQVVGTKPEWWQHVKEQQIRDRREKLKEVSRSFDFVLIVDTEQVFFFSSPCMCPSCTGSCPVPSPSPSFALSA